MYAALNLFLEWNIRTRQEVMISLSLSRPQALEFVPCGGYFVPYQSMRQAAFECYIFQGKEIPIFFKTRLFNCLDLSKLLFVQFLFPKIQGFNIINLYYL